MKIKPLYTAIFASFLACSAQAADTFDYSYITAAYAHSTLDDLDVDGTGFSLSGSAGLTDNLNLTAGYAKIGFDGDVDATNLGLGFGYHRSLNDSVDVVTGVGYLQQKADGPAGSVTDDAYQINAGLRAKAAEKIELDAGVTYVKAEDDNSTIFSVGAGYDISDTLQLGATYSKSSDVSSYGAGLRLNF
jgi:long-subunit fatty acid transport protein